MDSVHSQRGEQLKLMLRDPPQVDVDGIYDGRGICYIGKATQQFDGTWRALANVGGALCLMECHIRST